MLDNTITLTDKDAGSHSYDLVSREGMNSIRRETGVSSSLASALTIKNTVDISAPTKANRHLIQISKNELDGTTGELYPISVHCVISRHKLASDDEVLSVISELKDLLSNAGSELEDVLLGGN